MHETVLTNVGHGLIAGIAGTAVMTVAQVIEMKLSGREPSVVPAKAIEKLSGVQPSNQATEQRLSNLTHWMYGTSWGAVRGLLSSAGVNHLAATGLHFGAVWGAALLLLPALELSPPATQWSRKTVLKDALFHAVYAGAAGLAFAALVRKRR